MPTQADVARLAGVSRPMVSYALNNPTSVSIAEDTRQRIMDAIHTLGYVPDRVAQSLRTRKTHTIAGIFPDITNPFYPTFQRGMQDVARRHDYRVITANTDGLREEEAHCLEWVQQGFVDGAIFHFFHHDLAHIRPIIERGVVGVWLTANPIPPIDLPLDVLYMDNAKAARTGVNFLIERGHTRIAMITGAPSSASIERTRGYRLALTEHHISLDEMMIRNADFTERGGYAAMRELLELRPIPTAVFAANDLLAIGAMQAIHEAGLNIPADVAIVGLDDIPAARLVRPALTTITQFAERFGQRAAEMIFERLANPSLGPLRSEEAPFELVVRDSA